MQPIETPRRRERDAPQVVLETPSLGKLVRGYRVAAGLSQEALAEQAGLSVRGLSDLERGLRRAPYIDTLERLARALRLDESEQAKLLSARRDAVAHGHNQGPTTSVASGDLERSAGAFVQPRLPTGITTFIGRRKEVGDLQQLLQSARLITLVGIGGVGKTRLALEVASSLMGSFENGVWLVELASVADPLLVPQAVALALGVREQPDRPLLEMLVAHLACRQVLFVMDNCEHLLRACADLVETLVRCCAGVRVLATSREPLQIVGERAWRVPALAIPDAEASASPDELLRFSSAQLFVERAQAVQASFGVAPASAPIVAAICARLEGLPLAIELAAAWVRALGVEQILERLDDAFELLVGGSRTAPSRQQTMRATLDWSYGLLAPSEQIVFQRLAVFVGGWSLEAGEFVCASEGAAQRDVLSLLARLVDSSLVQVDEQEGRARYRLLEPVRQYAHEQPGCRGMGGDSGRAPRNARAALCESVRLHQDLGDGQGIAETLECVAALAASEREPELAVRFVGAAARIREQLGAPPAPIGRAMLDRWLVPLKQVLGAEKTTQAWEAGRHMAVERLWAWLSPLR